MSYDLTIYGSRRVDGEEIDAVVASVPGLAVGNGGGGETHILRGKRRQYSFTLSGPHDVESDDVPDDLVPHLLDPSISWQVIIEGSAPTEVRPARRFATALARAAAGVAFDEQTEEILGAKTTRKTTRPASELIRVLELQWYSPVSAPNAAELWLELARKILPEALPRRFGSVYPLRYRLDRDGDDQFVSTYSDVAWFTPTMPCITGGLYSNVWGGLHIDTLKLVAAPLDDARWRNTLRRFFVEYARRRHCVLATGEILRNHKLTGPPDHSWDLSDSLRGADGILGLPANPIWWTWLGDDYLSLTRGYLPGEQTTFYDEGALYAPTEDPTDRGQLATLRDPFPRDMRATAVPSDYGPANPPTNSAAAIRPSRLIVPPVPAYKALATLPED